MAGLFVRLRGGDGVALRVRMDGRKRVCRAFFRGKRIHLGAHEAVVLPRAGICIDPGVLPAGVQDLLVCEGHRGRGGDPVHPLFVLHGERCFWEDARLGEHFPVLCVRRVGVSFGILPVQEGIAQV